MSAAATRAHPLLLERYFEIALYLLIAVGFLILAGTGKLDALSLFFVAAVLLTRGVLLLRRKNFTIPTSWTNPITIGYAIFYVLDFFLLSKSFVYATVHLVLFAMAVKIFSVQRERDRMYLAVLAFLMVLAAAILTVDTEFLFLFCVFLVLAAATFAAQEMKRSAAAAKLHARSTGSDEVLPKWLSALAAALMAGILFLGAALFFLLPRRSGGYLSALAQNDEFVSGFSNDVELGNIGEIKRSSALVMHVKISGDASGAYSDMKWRGLALSYFDGHRWSRNPFSRSTIHRDASGRFPATEIGRRDQWDFNPGNEPNGKALSYHVIMEPIGTDVFFVASFATAIGGNYRYIQGDAAGSLFGGDAVIGAYDGFSNIETPTPAKLSTARGAIPANIASPITYLQLPQRLDPRVAALASHIASNFSDAYDKASAIEEYLKGHYGYTLQLPSKLPADPVANFLFERKEGHCEYFASAMAIMLRTQGIPARLVNGFRGAEFNDLDSTYIVRASSAHTWVEAYIAGYGWVSFDPTPPDPKLASTRWSRLGMYVDALGEFWREWVINYDLAHQFALQTDIRTGWQRQAGIWRRRLQREYRALLHSAESVNFRRTRRFGLLVALFAFLLMLAFNLRRMSRAWKRGRLASRPQEAPRMAASIWYERMLRALARQGSNKRPSQTPLEFARSIHSQRLRVLVMDFTERYESARFGESAEDAGKLPAMYDDISMLK